jgi:hypothetical protein
MRLDEESSVVKRKKSNPKSIRRWSLPSREHDRTEDPADESRTHTGGLSPNVPVSEEYIHSLLGCCKGEGSLVEAREREHRRDERAKSQKLRARSRELRAQHLRS